MVAWMRPLVSTTTALFALRHHSPTSCRCRSQRLFLSSMSEEGSQFLKPVVQYIFVRRDLEDWPTGALAAQAAHASVAAIVQATAQQDAATAYYTSGSQLSSMTKYVYGVDSVEELEAAKLKWSEKFGESYYYWMEQPENEPTAMATWPVERTNPVSKLIKNLKVTFL